MTDQDYEDLLVRWGRWAARGNYSRRTDGKPRALFIKVPSGSRPLTYWGDDAMLQAIFDDEDTADEVLELVLNHFEAKVNNELEALDD